MTQIVEVESAKQLEQALAIRVAVFVEEQGVSLAQEIDGHDDAARHLLALRDLQATERAIGLELRDSRMDRAILLVASTHANRKLVRQYIAPIRQSFPVDTRTTLAALAAGRDPGGNALVIL